MIADLLIVSLTRGKDVRKEKKNNMWLGRRLRWLDCLNCDAIQSESGLEAGMQ